MFAGLQSTVKNQQKLLRAHNRPRHLNSFGGKMIEDTIAALRELDEHPDTTFTVITGEGRFFAAGADVNGMLISSSILISALTKLHSHRRDETRFQE